MFWMPDVIGPLDSEDQLALATRVIMSPWLSTAAYTAIKSTPGVMLNTPSQQCDDRIVSLRKIREEST
jgi:hypothetical protein